MRIVWQQREYNADLHIKRCYVWASLDPTEKDVLIGKFADIWSRVRQKARAGKDGCATDDEFFVFHLAAITETSKKLAQIPIECELVSRYAIAYKWAEQPKGFPRFSQRA